jgi:hypothetical protein
MACPQVVDGGDSLQIWRVPVTVLNKQSWKADKGLSCSLRVGWVLATLHCKSRHCTKCYTGPSTFRDSLE